MRWLAGAAVVLLSAACTQVVPASSGPALAGTEWTIAQIEQSDPVAEATISFGTDAQVSGQTGCNRFFGPYTLRGSALTFGALGSTMIGCSDELAAQETAVLAALGATTTVQADADDLLLLDSSGNHLLRLTPAVPTTSPSLWDTTWQLSGIVTGQAVASPVADSTVTIQLSETGTLTGKACNTFRAEVSVKDDAISVGEIASTRMACPSTDLADQETAVLTYLQKATSYELDADQLTLTGPDGGLMFTAAG